MDCKIYKARLDMFNQTLAMVAKIAKKSPIRHLIIIQKV